MTTPTLAYLARAERRGARGTGNVNRLRPDECDCCICNYHRAKHDLMESDERA